MITELNIMLLKHWVKEKGQNTTAFATRPRNLANLFFKTL